jgi:ELWxxDGT repeat protein
MIRFHFRRFVACLWSGSRTAKRRPGAPRRTVVQPLESRVLLSAALVNDINLVGLPSSPSVLTEVNGTLYFSANDGTTGVELWKSDGTSTGTVLVRDIRSGDGTSTSSPSNLTNVNGTLYFQANDGTTGVELWKSDGTSAGTVLVRDIRSGGNSSSATNLTNVNGTLYFRANDGATGDELWKAISSSNTAPTSLTLSASSIAENQASGTSVGTFSTTDPDAGDTFTYTLVSGTGSTDNASFTIDGSTLKTAASFDFETKSSYSIRVRTTDQGGLSYEKQFTITVLDVNEAATQITLSNVVSVLLANANTSSAIRLADVSITDDGLGTNTFNVSGADASVFEVVAGQLRLKAGTVLNYTTQKTYSVTVNVDDTTVGGTPDASVNYTLSLQPLEGTTVQNGSVGRSYVRYVSLNFVVTQGLAEAVASVGTANSRIRLFFGGTTGTQSVAKTLTAGMVSLVGSQVKVDFGTQGVGGNAGTSLGDGIYRLRVDLDGDGLAEITGTFFRLFGDVDGNGLVNDTDISLVTAAQGTSGLNLATDLNGDGFVNATDLTNVKRRKGARVTL